MGQAMSIQQVRARSAMGQTEGGAYIHRSNIGLYKQGSCIHAVSHQHRYTDRPNWNILGQSPAVVIMHTDH